MVNGELHRPNFRRQSTSRRSKSQCASVFTSPKAEVSTKPKWVLVDPGYPSSDLNCYVPGPIHRQLEFYRCNCRGGTPVAARRSRYVHFVKRAATECRPYRLS